MDIKQPPTFQCQYCGKTANRRLLKYKNGKSNGCYDLTTKFCSKDCGWKGRRWRPINPAGHKHSTGYMRLHLRGGGKVFVHREVMSNHLGRPLTEHESVHHKNGNKTDNSISNLELWSRYQPPGQRVVDKVQFAIEILTQYPEFCRTAGYELRPLEHVSAAAP